MVNEKKYAEVVIYAISHEKINVDVMKNNLDLSEEELNTYIKSLSAGRIIENSMSDEFEVAISSIEDLDDDFLGLLHRNGYDDTFIVKCLSGFNSTQIVKSVIINNDWNTLNDNIPSGKVLIRIIDNNRIYHRDRDEVYYAEDMRLAEYVNGKWELIGPHQKYEYSPVVTRDHKIAPGCIVTHYKAPTEEELVIWDKRFNMHNHYEHLSLRIDDENEEMVYDSFTIALAALSNSINLSADDETKHKFAKAYTVISDLQSLIDTGREINNAVDQRQ